MKFPQLNLGRGKEAQNLLMQTAKERGTDVLLISEQHKWSENSAWYQDASRRAGILVCSPDLNIGDFLEIDAGSSPREDPPDPDIKGENLSRREVLSF